jgi:hypothetical protein
MDIALSLGKKFEKSFDTSLVSGGHGLNYHYNEAK